MSVSRTPDLLRAGAVAIALVLGGCSWGDAGQGPAQGAPASPPATFDPGEPAQDPDLEKFYDQELVWDSCGGGFECTSVTVPVAWDDPAGETIELSVVRLPAEGSRRGSLLVNPGGPGGSGVEYARSAQAVVSADVREAYDVVGFDPRGVGGSAPLVCLDDRQIDELVAADPTPDDPSEVQDLVRMSGVLASGCAERGGELAANVDTASAARDMDVLRAALGDDVLTYLGKSYGTLLGATYAELFPGRVGRMVLDGGVDPSLSGEEANLDQALGFERALAAFVEDCLQQSDCPLRGTQEQAMQQVRDLFERVDARPLTTDSGRQLTESLAVFGVALPLYESSAWPLLRQALTSAQAGDGTALLNFADLYFERNPDGTYTSNSATVIYAINCLDGAEEVTIEELAERAERYEQQAPTFGRFLAWGSLPCVYWEVEATEELGPLRAEGAAPILVVGTTRDPATPYQWSEGLADQLESAVLLTYDGDGHTAYLRSNACVNDAVDAYLLEGTLPEEGTVC